MTDLSQGILIGCGLTCAVWIAALWFAPRAGKLVPRGLPPGLVEEIRAEQDAELAAWAEQRRETQALVAASTPVPGPRRRAQ